MINEDKKNKAAKLLRAKADVLGRVPKKDDFDDVTVSKIKAYLGPWPRALEYADLKEKRAKKKKSKKRKNKKASSRCEII